MNIKTLFIATAFLFLLSFPAAAQADVETFMTGIAQRSAGLVYISEADSLVTPYLAPRGAAYLSQRTFVRAAMLPPAIAVEERDYEQVYDRLTERETDGRWMELRTYLEKSGLEQRKAYIITFSDGSKRTYLVGIYAGRICGVWATVVET